MKIQRNGKKERKQEIEKKKKEEEKEIQKNERRKKAAEKKKDFIKKIERKEGKLVRKSESWVEEKKKNWRSFRNMKESESDEDSSIETEDREMIEFGSQFSYNFDFSKTILSIRLGPQSTARKLTDTAGKNLILVQLNLKILIVI